MATAPLNLLPAILLALASITSTGATSLVADQEYYYWSTLLAAGHPHAQGPQRPPPPTAEPPGYSQLHQGRRQRSRLDRRPCGGGEPARDTPVASEDGDRRRRRGGEDGGKNRLHGGDRQKFSAEPVLLRTGGGGAVAPRIAAGNQISISIDPAAELNRPAVLLSRPKVRVTDANTFTAAADGNLIDRPTVPSFFLEKDLRRGAKMKFWANRAFSGDFFLPREVADSIPFSPGRLPELLSRFALRPDSVLAERMAETLRMCWGGGRQRRLCATSLESMVDSAAAALGTRDLETASTVVDGRVPGQVYTVDSWSAVPIAGATTLACHALVYPYTVFRCHPTPASRAYRMRLVGADGAEVAAAAMCHGDTSAWEPTLAPLVAFREKPGGAAVCHLLQEGDVLWFARSRAGAVAVASA